MMRHAIQVVALFFVGMLWALPATAEDLNVAGKWDVTIRMPDRNVSEQWVITQEGHKVSGNAKSPAGETHAVVGEVNGVVFRVDSRNGDVYKVRATVDEDEMDGSVTIGNKEYLWSAKRSKT